MPMWWGYPTSCVCGNSLFRDEALPKRTNPIRYPKSFLVHKRTIFYSRNFRDKNGYRPIARRDCRKASLQRAGRVDRLVFERGLPSTLRLVISLVPTAKLYGGNAVLHRVLFVMSLPEPRLNCRRWGMAVHRSDGYRSWRFPLFWW